jgi:hypothetical protein
VTVALCIPAFKPVFGTTVKVSVLPTSIFCIESDDNSKLAALSPESAADKIPVGLMATLCTLIIYGVKLGYS